MYNHAPEGYVCPFCLLIQGVEGQGVLTVQEDIIYQDDSVTAFVGSHQWPNNPGNVLVAPNQHHENLYDLPLHLAAQLHRVTRVVALAMKEAYRCDGVSTRQHNEPAGNQDVWHYHVHVTPRYVGDDFYRTERALMAPAERAEHARRLRGLLAGGLPDSASS
jgi:histidine triad (HIT) family protein